MLQKIKLLVGGLALVATVAVAQDVKPVHMRGGWGDGPGLFGFYTRALNLTADQQTQIKQLVENEKPTMKPLMQQEAQNREAIMQLAMSANFDAGKAQTLAAQESQAHVQLEVEHAKLASQAYQLLTADQKTKLAEIMAKHQQRMQRRSQQEQPQGDTTNQ